ncbi:MAG: ABC transporter permease [Chloroflexi bacterium]|nr:ABC transporter permease [Chloroflexota bacterium]
MTTAAPGQEDVDLGLRVEQGSPLRRAWTAAKRFARLQPGGTFGIIFILLIVVAAIFAPHLKTIGEGERDVRRIAIAEGRQLDSTGYLQPPNSDWWLGTNSAGQDVWSRVIYGARPALLIGVGSVGIAMTVAVVLSLAMGFMKGFVDAFLLRLIETGIAVPGLVWLILFTTAIDRSLPVIMVAVALAFAPLTTLVLRGNVLQEAGTQYVEAARVIGASNMRIMAYHILPNLLPLAIVNASIIVPAAIMTEAGLAFLGFGLPPPSPSWGVDIGPSARAYFYLAWWLPVFPGIALSLTVLAFNFLGDSLRDVLDPRMRGSGLV